MYFHTRVGARLYIQNSDKGILINKKIHLKFILKYI